MVPKGGWFKLQTDITEDPAVRKLDAEAFRVYVSILCVLRQREYVAGDLLVPFETISYHSGLEKESILVRLRDISRTELGTAEYLKRTKEVRLNFPKWLDHQWESIRKLRNFSGMSPEEVRRIVASEAPRLDEMRRDESPGRHPSSGKPCTLNKKGKEGENYKSDLLEEDNPEDLKLSELENPIQVGIPPID